MGYCIVGVLLIGFFWFVGKVGGPGPHHCSKCKEYYETSVKKES